MKDEVDVMMKEKMIITLKKIVVTMVMAAMLISNGLLSINAQAVAAESQDWYVYYNDSHTNYEECPRLYAFYSERLLFN